uniref:Low-density lipoprotein receptor domain class A n=1 Tax=Macrostomum lignano TaxID=282301 RepID=A0A1I8FFE9_9PLAT
HRYSRITIATVVLLSLLASVTGYRQPLRNQLATGLSENCTWPCKSGQCLAFFFICDGRSDCIDGYDEDSALCTAKEPNVRDYAAKVHLTPEQTEKLILTLEYARDGRVIDLILDGMPEELPRRPTPCLAAWSSPASSATPTSDRVAGCQSAEFLPNDRFAIEGY